ncbi:hypothetical protein [Streptomyces sp. NPDC046805]|uniref:hypothetical protein n=1 Tax=Streptomyces sp. NPDC046805 TaxID=3155134 RepID=UPI0033EF60EE
MSDRHTDRSTTQTQLTTEDLARPAPSRDTTSDETRPKYPGEATARERAWKAPDERDRGADVTDDAEATETVEEGAEPLIDPQDTESYRARWEEIQGTFVDDPKDAVHSADALVADVIQSLAETFADHKKELEAEWSRGEKVETEELRVALQQYRTFFNQLLHA